MTGKWILTAVACLLLSAPAPSPAEVQDIHTIWSNLLDKHVENGVVDYQGMKADEATLDAYLEILDATDPATLPENKRLALYINAYNSYTVKLILNHFEKGSPPESIKDIGGFFSGPWKIEFCRIGGEIYTLDEIEHEIIRPVFQDPRVHFAVNCASKSCPPLISRAYRGHDLDRQLTENTVNFINDSKFNYLDGSTLYLSRIFKWFSEDFEDGILDFVTTYARGELKERLREFGDEVDIRYLDYDWSLNAR